MAWRSTLSVPFLTFMAQPVFWLPVDGVGDGVTFLGMVGGRVGQLDGGRCRGPVPRSDGQFEFGKDEVAVVGPAGTLLGQAVVCQGLQTNGCDRFQISQQGHGVCVVGRNTEIDDQGPVFQLRQYGSLVGLPLEGVQELKGARRLGRQMLRPSGQAGTKFLIVYGQRLLCRGHCCGQSGLRLGLILGRDGDLRPRSVGIIVVFAVVEDGKNAVEISLGDGVKFMGMAASTSDCQSQKDRAGRVDAVDDGFDTGPGRR